MIEMMDGEQSRPLVIVHVQTRMLTGGAEENTWASCLHQAKAGHTVHLVCGRDSKVEHYRVQNSPIQVHLVPDLVRDIAPGADYAAYKSLSRLFKELKPDIVHTHTSKAGIVGRFAARNAKVPAVIHGVHMLPFSNVGLAQKAIYLFAEHAASPLTDHFIHVSHGTHQAYAIARVGRSKPHSVVRSGMDIDKFEHAAWPDDWRSILGVEEEAKKPRIILMLAAMEGRKRHAEFIRGFLAEAGDDRSVHLLLAGDGPEMAAVTALVDELGASDRVHLLGHRSDPERLIALADICTLASLREGLPRVIVQGLAGGKPAVVSPVQGIEEVVDHDRNGIIVPDDTAQAVARESVRLVRNTDRLAAMTHAAENAEVADWKFVSMFEHLDRAYKATLADVQVRARFDRRAAAVTGRA